PMVAFNCKKPAMHMTNEGWVSDDGSAIECPHDPKNILEYCKRVYPDLDVRNVMETTELSQITNWCRNSKRRCYHHSYTVRPYKCL
ncbi:hypothetical protein HELRODRAFT_137927, partial [Helobdella robusta]|uniref:E1 domain-containing protein n=1 Tax=Helobdella robusta TaxID=6412 RepID=T1EIP9_HELRO